MTRGLGVFVTLLALTLPLAAQPLAGEVMIETLQHSAFFGSAGYQLYHAAPGYPVAHAVWYADLPSEIAGPGPLFPSGKNLFFGNGDTIYFWHDQPDVEAVLQDENEISEMAPMRNGNFLAAERFADPIRGAKLIELTLAGHVREYDFPRRIDEQNRAVGAEHIELLSDQCTMIYTLGAFDDAVHRMNLCTGQPEADFVILGTGYAGAIRQLPGGDILVADGRGVDRYTAAGWFVTFYELPGATHIALSSTGTAFYAAGVMNGDPDLRLFDADHATAVESWSFYGTGASSFNYVDRVTDLTLRFEWRASAQPLRRRAVR